MLVCREDLGTGAGAGLLDGRYELQNELGRGATGVVWEAVDRVSSEMVAVKILHRHLLSSVRARRRFVREARSAGVLKHPHSVAVMGHGCGPDGDAYLVMERLLGVTLATLLKNNSEFSQLRAIRIVAQILEAVSAAHRVSILHRDLKPNNVMLIEHDGDPDFVKVCDFGLAKEFDGAQASSLLTDHGEVCGTPAYMAPEQARGEPLDARADVYAVGVMLFQAVVGRLPFQASSPFALASMHLSAPPPRPSDLRPDIAFFPPLESLILRALSKNKAERPSSAEVFRADLLQIERDYRSGDWDRAGGPQTDTLAPAEGIRSGSARTKRLGLSAAFVVVVAAASVFAARSAAAPSTGGRAGHRGRAGTGDGCPFHGGAPRHGRSAPGRRGRRASASRACTVLAGTAKPGPPAHEHPARSAGECRRDRTASSHRRAAPDRRPRRRRVRARPGRGGAHARGRGDLGVSRSLSHAAAGATASARLLPPVPGPRPRQREGLVHPRDRRARGTVMRARPVASIAGPGLIACAIAATLACSTRGAEFYEGVFKCDATASQDPCGTTAAGKPMTCFAGGQLGGEDFCAEVCDPAHGSDDPGYTCVSSGALLQLCHPNAAGSEGCPPELQCYRTDLLADEGVCLMMRVCAQDSDCSGDPARRICAASLVRGMYSLPTLKADHLQCLQATCQSGGSLCSDGESCLANYTDQGPEIPDICVPNCDSDRDCPPNFACSISSAAPGSPPICLPGLPGTRCVANQDCVVGSCVDTGAGSANVRFPFRASPISTAPRSTGCRRRSFASKVFRARAGAA